MRITAIDEAAISDPASVCVAVSGRIRSFQFSIVKAFCLVRTTLV